MEPAALSPLEKLPTELVVKIIRKNLPDKLSYGAVIEFMAEHGTSSKLRAIAKDVIWKAASNYSRIDIPLQGHKKGLSMSQGSVKLLKKLSDQVRFVRMSGFRIHGVDWSTHMKRAVALLNTTLDLHDTDFAFSLFWDQDIGSPCETHADRPARALGDEVTDEKYYADLIDDWEKN